MTLLVNIITTFSALMILLVFKSDFTNTPLFIDDSVKVFYKEFITLAKNKGSDLRLRRLTIRFANIKDKPYLAYCVPALNSVVISSKHWREMDSNKRRILIFHELGHCTLKREHVTDYRDDLSCPKSIMYPYMESLVDCFLKHKEEYINELFVNPHGYEHY